MNIQNKQIRLQAIGVPSQRDERLKDILLNDGDVIVIPTMKDSQPEFWHLCSLEEMKGMSKKEMISYQRREL